MEEDLCQVDNWKKLLAAGAQKQKHGGDAVGFERGDDSGACVSMSNMTANPSRADHGGVEPAQNIPEMIKTVNISDMKHDRRRAYTIVERHLTDNLAGRGCPQLLMQIQGEGGTGKST
ncbi:hypothetical protein FRC07_013604, partial [Ceratobasidium sp. 392]